MAAVSVPVVVLYSRAGAPVSLFTSAEVSSAVPSPLPTHPPPWRKQAPFAGIHPLRVQEGGTQPYSGNPPAVTMATLRTLK